MPVINFPKLDLIRLALASGAVPPSVYRMAAGVGFDAEGGVWLRPTAAISRDTARALNRLGAVVHRDGDNKATEEIGNWLELVPLVEASISPDGRLPEVLIDLPDGSSLAKLVAEGRRLGAGKVSVRWPDASPRDGETSGRVLVLMESPPFHSLFHANRRAYIQQMPRVWVEVGWSHPLAEMIDPARGKIALLGAPRTWQMIPDGSFQSGPDVFLVPERAVRAESGIELQIPAPVRLVTAADGEPPELWVLHDQSFDRLHALAEQTDDRLLSRLSVAIGEANGRQVAVLRARASRGGPPVLMLDGLACRPHLRLPNLYLPVGYRFRPPLRRDAVRQLLAPDADAVVWLAPGESGAFSINTISEAAFRPLEELIAYKVDHEQAPLSAPESDNPLALAPFVSHERGAVAPRRRGKQQHVALSAGIEAPVTSRPSDVAPGLVSRIVRWFAPRSGAAVAGQPDAGLADEPPRSLDAREDRRRLLEERLVTSLNLPESPERAATWPELARLYSAMNRWPDAAACWLIALWESDDPPAQWGRGWMQAEAAIARGTGAGSDLDKWLDMTPTPATVRAIAAAVAQQRPMLGPSLDRVQRLLDEHEEWVPVRAAWLARVGLARLTGGDVVGLARARDRLLERLHDHGLSADLDVLATIRFAGAGAGERRQAARVWLTGARASIHRWLNAGQTAAAPLTSGDDSQLNTFGLSTANAPTASYSDLILAWGLARLGERGAAQELLSQAQAALAGLDETHDFLLEAFTVRIGQALDGRTSGPLPADLLARLLRLRDLERNSRAARERLSLVKVQQFLRHSRILEPSEFVDAFGEGWLDLQIPDGPDPDLAELRFITDRDELTHRLLAAVASTARDEKRLPKLLVRALDLAPRLGEVVAAGILDRLLAALHSWSFAGPADLVEAQVLAVERGLFVAAHFDRAEAVQQLLTNLNRLLESRRGGDPGESRPVEDALLALLGQGLRGLRRLGLRTEADRLLEQLAEWVAPHGDLSAERRRRPQAWPLTMRRMLVVAGGWFYVGRDGPATEIIDEARRLLFSRDLMGEPHRRHQTDLACAYAAALAHAPVRLAVNGVTELFAQLPPLSDNLVTNTHFSLAKLRLVEAAIRAVVTDDFALGPAVRRWLDDDEFRVRQRIHRDTRAMLGVRP